MDNTTLLLCVNVNWVFGVLRESVYVIINRFVMHILWMIQVGATDMSRLEPQKFFAKIWLKPWFLFWSVWV